MAGQKPLRKFEFLPALKARGFPDGVSPVDVRQHTQRTPYSSREYGPIDTIVIHATAGSSSAGAISVMKAGRASWHYLVPDEDEYAHGGFVWRHVPLKEKAWHVLRRIEFPREVEGRVIENHPGWNDINSRAYGIEVVNQQRGDADPFSDWQVKATAHLVHRLRMRHSHRMYLATHAYLDPSRKSDPGQHFPWGAFMSRIQELENEQSVKVVRLPGTHVIDCNPDLEEGTMRCDLRPLAEDLGYEVIWNEKQQKAYLRDEESDTGG